MTLVVFHLVLYILAASPEFRDASLFGSWKIRVWSMKTNL